MDRLSQELIIKIAGSVADVKSLVRLAATCHSWREIVSRPDCWSEVVPAQTELTFLYRDNILLSTMRRGITRLEVSSNDLDVEICMPALEGLKVTTVNSATLPDLHLRLHFPQLKRVQCIDCPVSFSTQLTTVIVKDWKRTSPEQWAKLAICHSLEFVHGGGLLYPTFAKDHPHIKRLQWQTSGVQQADRALDVAADLTSSSTCQISMSITVQNSLQLSNGIRFHWLEVTIPTMTSTAWLSQHAITHIKICANKFVGTLRILPFSACTTVELDVKAKSAHLDEADMGCIQHFIYRYHMVGMTLEGSDWRCDHQYITKGDHEMESPFEFVQSIW